MMGWETGRPPVLPQIGHTQRLLIFQREPQQTRVHGESAIFVRCAGVMPEVTNSWTLPSSVSLSTLNAP